MRTWVIAALVFALDGDRAGAGRRRRRAVVPENARPCHDIGEGAKVKLGPPLNGLEGRKAGTYEGFNYSEANKNSGITWDKDAIRQIHPQSDAGDARHPDGLRRHQERQGDRRPVGLPQAIRRGRQEEVSAIGRCNA